MSHLIEMSGKIFGRWTVLERRDNENRTGAYWLCMCECGTRRSVYGRSLRQGISNSCGCLNRDIGLSRRGPKSGAWKGGRLKTSCGYMHVHAPEHPAVQKSGYVPEHRLVMEKMLGRSLYPEETIHHINGVRDDNRECNLELWTIRQPKGQRISDLVAWAREILELYRGAE